MDNIEGDVELVRHLCTLPPRRTSRIAAHFLRRAAGIFLVVVVNVAVLFPTLQKIYSLHGSN